MEAGAAGAGLGAWAAAAAVEGRSAVLQAEAGSGAAGWLEAAGAEAHLTVPPWWVAGSRAEAPPGSHHDPLAAGVPVPAA